MAGKKSSSKINMAAEIRALLEQDSNITGKEVFGKLKDKFPKENINQGSCLVAFSNARKALGLRGNKKSVRKRVPGVKASRATSGKADFGTLQAARDYVAQVGDPETAISVIKELSALQLSN